jgi:hypothetical protein
VAPNLSDPAERAAYQRELAGVGLRSRRIGIVMAVAGALLVLAHKRGFDALPVWVGAGVLGLGMLTTIAAVSTRAAYHRLRMRH